MIRSECEGKLLIHRCDISLDILGHLGLIRDLCRIILVLKGSLIFAAFLILCRIVRFRNSKLAFLIRNCHSQAPNSSIVTVALGAALFLLDIELIGSCLRKGDLSKGLLTAAGYRNLICSKRRTVWPVA